MTTCAAGRDEKCQNDDISIIIQRRVVIGDMQKYQPGQYERMNG